MIHLTCEQDTPSDSGEQKKSVTRKRPKNILEAFEHIVELAKDSNLSPDFLEKTSAYVRYASRKLKLSPMQVVLLALFVDHSENSRIRISEIARMQIAVPPKSCGSHPKSMSSKKSIMYVHPVRPTASPTGCRPRSSKR